MKEEVTRIMRLVKEGKISPEDAAELVEAFVDSPDDPVPPTEDPGAKADDPFAKLISGIEKLSRDVGANVNWQDIAGQVRVGVSKGVESLRQAAEEARKSGRFAVVFGTSANHRVEMPVRLTAGQTLRIEGGSGSVRVFGGVSEPKMVFDVAYRALDEAEAAQLAKGFVPVVEEGDGHVRYRGPDGPNVRVDVEAHVPSGTVVEVASASGDVDLTATLAGCRIQTVSGDVTLTGVAGTVDVSVGSGDLTVRHADVSLLNADSRSGDVTFEEVSGALNLKSSSGDVRFVKCRCQSLAVELASGDVSVDLVEPVSGTVSVRTVSGDVTVGVSDGSDCRVSLSSLSGSVATRVALDDFVEEGQLITGRMGAGSGSLDLSAVRGSVLLEYRDSTA
jgi:hypothetical protein